MSQVSRLGAVVGALVLGLPVLAACSDDPPSASPPPTASSSPTSSATPPGPPELPAAARGTTPAAAKAFVRYYVELINYATATLDTSAMEASSLESCDNCRSIVEIARNMRAAGRHYEGGRWNVVSIVQAPAPTGSRIFQVVVRVATLKVLDPDGKSKSVKAARSLVTVTVRRDKNWKVADFKGVRT